jgi:hypothetical protein
MHFSSSGLTDRQDALEYAAILFRTGTTARRLRISVDFLSSFTQMPGHGRFLPTHLKRLFTHSPEVNINHKGTDITVCFPFMTVVRAPVVSLHW